MKKMVIGTMLNLVLCSSAVFASDLCENLPGTWRGNGVLEIDIAGSSKCVYHGTSTVTSFNSNSHLFSSQVSMQLIHGLCPPEILLDLSGKCLRGHIAMNSDDGSSNFSGQLLPSGKTGTLSGNMVFDIDGTIYQASFAHAVMVKA